MYCYVSALFIVTREFSTLIKPGIVVQMKSNLQELLKYFEPVQKKCLSECLISN